MRVLFLVAALLGTLPASASPLAGYWLGPLDPDGNRSTIEIYPCEGLLCGRVAQVTQDSARQLLNQIILLDLRQQDADTYVGGTIRFDHLRWTFSGSIQMAGPDQATLRGCWAGIFCQSVPFTRVEL